MSQTTSAGVQNLAMLKKGQSAIVSGMASAVDAGTEQASVSLRLIELGFCEGEKVRVLAESFPGGDPMAIRVGSATFALRRHEAAMVLVEGVVGN